MGKDKGRGAKIGKTQILVCSRGHVIMGPKSGAISRDNEMKNKKGIRTGRNKK